MNLLENWDFYLGALLACASVEVTIVAGALSFARSKTDSRGQLSPVLLFLAPYFGFLALSYGRPFLSIQDVPSVQPRVFYGWSASLYTVSLYLLGGLAFFAGYVAYRALSRRYGWIGNLVGGGLFRAFKRTLRGRKVPYFILAVLALWLIGLVANVGLFFQVRGIPLFTISIRESEDPKLTFLAEFQPMIVLLAPFVTVLHSAVPARYRRLLRVRVYAVLVLVSLCTLTLLGARNLPAKLALGLFLFWILAPSRRSRRTPADARRRIHVVSNRTKIAIALGILLFVSIGIAGALSKVEIYRMSPQQLPGVVFGAPVADGIGNLYSFEAVANYTGLYGHFRGTLLYTTFLSYIPGRDELYANYIVGEILGYPVAQLQSISSTFNGPALLDFGVLGLIFNSYIFGSLLAYGWEGTKTSPRNSGAFALFLSTVILGIHLGTYNLWTFFAIFILIACVEYNKVP